jgi:plastocyanin
MKNLIAIIAVVLAGTFSAAAQIDNADNIPTISLDQTPGEFTQKTITVDAGTYIFTINNKNVKHDVGFVLVKKGADVSNPDNHIKTAYVTAPVANNETGQSSVTDLIAGEYNYFRPLNPTATDNLLIVK